MTLHHALSLQPIIANICSKLFRTQVPLGFLLKCTCCWTAHDNSRCVHSVVLITLYGLPMPVHLTLNISSCVFKPVKSVFIISCISYILAIPAPVLHVVLVPL